MPTDSVCLGKITNHSERASFNLISNDTIGMTDTIQILILKLSYVSPC